MQSIPSNLTLPLQMHQLISLRSYFYTCDIPSEQKNMSFFFAKNPVDVRQEVVTGLDLVQNLDSMSGHAVQIF